jgi:Ring hydroxylating alpha subunit (catalytic domain)
MEFDYYHQGSDVEFEEYFKFVRQVALEDFELCEKAQSNLQKGIYREEILNPKKENGVAFYQQQVRQMIYDQLAIEEEAAKSSGALEESEIATVTECGNRAHAQTIAVL